jgi:hypothetical protein
MTSRRKASAGILGSAIVALAVLTMGSGSLLHSKGIGRFNGVDFVGEVVPPEANVVARRRVIPMFGLGLVDAVPDQTLQEIPQLQQEFTPETAGRALALTDVFSGQPRVGRFGWKSQIGTVLTFTAATPSSMRSALRPRFSLMKTPHRATSPCSPRIRRGPIPTIPRKR